MINLDKAILIGEGKWVNDVAHQVYKQYIQKKAAKKLVSYQNKPYL